MALSDKLHYEFMLSQQVHKEITKTKNTSKRNLNKVKIAVLEKNSSEFIKDVD